jgi:hypothetical protein
MRELSDACQAAHLGTLEQDVLEEVSCAIVGVCLKPASRVDPNAHGRGLSVRIGFACHTQAIAQCRHLQRLYRLILR